MLITAKTFENHFRGFDYGNTTLQINGYFNFSFHIMNKRWFYTWVYDGNVLADKLMEMMLLLHYNWIIKNVSISIGNSEAAVFGNELAYWEIIWEDNSYWWWVVLLWYSMYSCHFTFWIKQAVSVQSSGFWQFKHENVCYCFVWFCLGQNI